MSTAPIEQWATTTPRRLYLVWRQLWTITVVLSLMSCCALILLLLHLVTLGKARHFGMNVVARGFSRFVLWCCGIRVNGPPVESWPAEPVIYIANHTSTLDFFIVTALGLPNMRAFLSVKNRVFVPIWVMGELLGHFFIPTQDDRPGRVACFERASHVLRDTEDSVFLTPEGTRHVDGDVGPFNKGAFHLATALRRPLIPLYIEIAPEMNPGKGFKTRPGVVDVYMSERMDTTDWRVEDVEHHRDDVRAFYVAWRQRDML